MTETGVVPTFVVAGAQKSGTTWLFECLDEHPEVFVPTVKEVHFFCPTSECRFSTANNGEGWYKTQFKSDGSTKALGDLSTDYMYYSECAGHLAKYNPALKVIFMLRNPIDRAYSAYWMWRRHTPDLPPFREVLRQNDSLVARGLYTEQIKRYFRTFPKNQIRVYIYEEFIEAPDSSIEDLYRFIGVDAQFYPKMLRKRVGETKQLPRGVGRFVYKVGARVLNNHLIRPWWRWTRRNTNLKERALKIIGYGQARGYPKLSDEDRKFLQDLYDEENENLRKLLGRARPIWN
jgi:hypothetical protein